MDTDRVWRALDVAVCGGGIGGLATAISLRRAGHHVTIYERSDYVGEVGASISCAANASRWLDEWGVDAQRGDPVIIKHLINRDWQTGEAVSTVDLSDYRERWGHNYYNFHRKHMHSMLLYYATEDTCKPGIPARLAVGHKFKDVNVETGKLCFEYDGATVDAQHDLIIAADGVGSAMRRMLGIEPVKTPSNSTCLHANVDLETVKKLGLPDLTVDNAFQYWGSHHELNKIVRAPCNGGKLLSYYCFFPRAKGDYQNHSWDETVSKEQLLAPYPDLDRKVLANLEASRDIKPWRLWIHEPYDFWVKGRVALLGDAAHPMMPDQSQGACMAIEDAACLGILLGPQIFRGDIARTLAVYEAVRKPRASRVQAAAARARDNIHERIGFSDNTDNPQYSVQDEDNKLTMEEMNSYDMREHITERMAAVQVCEPSRRKY